VHIAKENIARTVDRLDQLRVLGVLAKLRPQPRDAHIHRPVKTLGSYAAECFLHLRAADQAFRSVEEQAQHLAFGMGEGDLGTLCILQDIAVEMRGPAVKPRGGAGLWRRFGAA